MRARTHLLLPLAAAILVGGPVAAAEDDTETTDSVWAPIVPPKPAADSRWAGNYQGAVQLGAGYTSDDSYMFGEYNGLDQEGTTLIGNLRWRDFSDADSYWKASVDDLGLDTRQGELTWGYKGKLRLDLSFDSQAQVRGDEGLTPYRGGDKLSLPDNWVAGPNTSSWPELYAALHHFDQKLERDKVGAKLSAAINRHWSVNAGMSYEEKQGTGNVAGAFYPDASQGNSALLPNPIDYRTSEYNLGLQYSTDKLHLDGQLDYVNFDNRHDLLTWENAYTGLYPGDITGYPAQGGLGMAPDNDQLRGRLTGQWIITPTARLQFDSSYARATQDQNFAGYTVNPELVVYAPPPRKDLNGKVDIGTLNGKLILRPLPKLDVEAFYHGLKRNYDMPRDAYPYVRGDSTDQPGQALAVYDSAYDYSKESAGAEAAYRLPLRSRLSVGYSYIWVQRQNTAVSKTKEDQYTVAYRIQPWNNFTSRLELLYGDRSANTYQWAQSYYGLLDAELINATPDNQRYINHPAFSQYYMSNREQMQGKLDFSWVPATPWNLNLNLLWRKDDYDETELGLTDADWTRVHASASYAPTASLSTSVYAGYDQYKSKQTGRAFRGGQEKDAFEIYPPLPQASDPSRDWDLNARDGSITVGANVAWQAAPDLALEADYNYVDTNGKQKIGAHGAADLDPQDYPSVHTKLHHLTASATWSVNTSVDLRLDYQYYRYRSNDWAWQNVQVNTIDNVLTFGAGNPNEHINYVGASAIYRWQ